VRSRKGNAVRTWHSLFFSRPSSRSGSKMAEWWGPELVLRHSHQSFSGPSRVCESRSGSCSRRGTGERKRKRERKKDASLERALCSGFSLSYFAFLYIFLFAPTIIKEKSSQSEDRSIDRLTDRKNSLPWEKRRSLTESAHCAQLRAPG